MASLKVTRDGEVQTTAGVIPPTGTAGTWSPGSVSYTLDKRISEGGKQAARQAKCTFTFTGKTTATPPVDYTEKSTVTLASSSSLVRAGGAVLLRHGDMARDKYGNLLTANARGHLHSS